MTESIKISGTPAEIGEQMADRLLAPALDAVVEKFDQQDFEVFCCAMLAAITALIGQRVGRHRVAEMAIAVATAANKAAQEEMLQ